MSTCSSGFKAHLVQSLVVVAVSLSFTMLVVHECTAFMVDYYATIEKAKVPHDCGKT